VSQTRDTRYAREIVTAAVGESRIERIFVKDEGRVEIRFSWWPNGKMAMRPLDLDEERLLHLMEEAIAKGVFSEGYLQGLTKILASHAQFPEMREEAV
jgi:hypothetical protein